MPTKASGVAESPSLDAKLALTDSETKFDDVVPKINIGDQDEGHAGPNSGIQDEGQAGPNPGVQDECQARSNPGDAVESQPQSSHVVHAGPNLEHMDLEATDASTHQNPEQMDKKPSSSTGTLSSLQNLEKELSFTDQFFVEKQQEEDPGKTNAEAEAHEDHKKLYDAMEKSLERDYSDQLLLDLDEAHQKKRKRRDLQRTPSRSPLPQPTTPPPSASASSTQADVSGTQELSHTDSLIQDDFIPNEQVQLFDDEDWWKPLPEEERPATPGPFWTISSSKVSDVENKWATTLVSTYETTAKNSLLAKTEDMTKFPNWYCRQVNKTKPTQADLEGIGSSLTLLISKMKAASYPDFGLELLVSEQMWIDDVYMILRRIEKKSDHTYGFSGSSELKPTQDT
nr:hypothetical protein [Tanacetum cinerariifolium]